MATLRPEQVIAGYQAATDSVRSRVLAYVSAIWANTPSYRDADIDRIVNLIVPRVQAGQMQMAMLTDAYVSQLAVQAGVAWSPGVDRSVIGYRGVPADVVYRRPAVQTYTALSNGAPVYEAIAQGAHRLASIVSTDMQQAKNRQAQRSFGGSGFEYTERVLTGRENCALCVIASTQRYHKAVLMPIHPGCDCGQRGVKAASDPGQVLSPQLLEQTHALIDAKVGGTDRSARVITGDNPISDFLDLIVTNEHGELGPTLGWRADHFTGPSGLI